MHEHLDHRQCMSCNKGKTLTCGQIILLGSTLTENLKFSSSGSSEAQNVGI